MGNRTSSGAPVATSPSKRGGRGGANNNKTRADPAETDRQPDLPTVLVSASGPSATTSSGAPPANNAARRGLATPAGAFGVAAGVQVTLHERVRRVLVLVKVDAHWRARAAARRAVVQRVSRYSYPGCGADIGGERAFISVGATAAPPSKSLHN